MIKRFRHVLAFWPVCAVAPVLGLALMQFAGFLDFDCHWHPVNNPRCWEKDAYAWAGLATFAVAIVGVGAALADAVYRRWVARRPRS